MHLLSWVHLSLFVSLQIAVRRDVLILIDGLNPAVNNGFKHSIIQYLDEPLQITGHCSSTRIKAEVVDR